MTDVSSIQRIVLWPNRRASTASSPDLGIATFHRSRPRLGRTMVVLIIAGVVALLGAPVTHAEDSVTYQIFSDRVAVLSGVEYRDSLGKHRLAGVPLPWQITVPVADALSPTDRGAELRADWRPNFRTAWTVGAVLRGQFVTVRILSGGRILCQNTLDVGNATCYGSVPHRS